MNDKNREWWKSPIRIFRRGAISILGAYFFVNGLAKGGVTILVLMLFLGDGLPAINGSALELLLL